MYNLVLKYVVPQLLRLFTIVSLPSATGIADTAAATTPAIFINVADRIAVNGVIVCAASSL